MKRLFIFLIFFAFLLAVTGNYLLWQTEHTYRQDDWLAQKLTLRGVYFTAGQDENAQPLPQGYRISAAGNEAITIVGHFNRDIPINQLLMMRIDNMRVKLSVNGREIYSFGQTGSIPPQARSPGNGWISCISPGIRAEDEVSFELTNVYAGRAPAVYETFLTNLYSGYEKPLITSHLGRNLLNTFAALSTFCLGITIAVFSFTLFRMNKPALLSLSLTAAAIFSGIWFFIDFEVQSYYLPFPVLNNSLDIVSLLFTASFICIYLALRLKNKWRILLFYNAAAWLLLIIGTTFAQLHGWSDYYDAVPYINLLICTSVITYLFLLRYERRAFPDNVSSGLVVSTVFICLGAIGDMLCNIFGLLSYTIFFKIGFLLFLLLQFFVLEKSIRNFICANIKLQILQEQKENLIRLMEYQQLINDSIKGLYENIHEIDLTHNCAGNNDTRLYFERLGLSEDTPYSEALHQMAQTKIKEEFRQNYLHIFSPHQALTAYASGITSLKYDYLIHSESRGDCWMRITARLFFWSGDQSIRMLTFHQNIDAEKKRELQLTEQLKKDALTNLYNKVATESLIKEILANPSNARQNFAFLIIDIDYFKSINDTFGHAAGDRAITKFAEALKAQFRNTDIIGRIGGDEFVVFLPVPSREWIENKTNTLLENLRQNIEVNTHTFKISASIGIALSHTSGKDFTALYENADTALYQTKEHGRNSFIIYEKL